MTDTQIYEKLLEQESEEGTKELSKYPNLLEAYNKHIAKRTKIVNTFLRAIRTEFYRNEPTINSKKTLYQFLVECDTETKKELQLGNNTQKKK